MAILENEVGSLEVSTNLFINNEFVEGRGESFETINPATCQIITKVKEASAEDVDQAVKCAHAAFEGWKTTCPKQRRDLILTLSNLIEKHQVQLAEIESLDSGKPRRVCQDTDVRLVVETLRYYAGWCDKVEGRSIPTSADYLCYTVSEPVGIVGQIIPWNFPLLMFAWKIAPALAAGCTLVLKSSEKTPLSVLLVCQLVIESGFPPGIINVIAGRGLTTGEWLTSHPLIDKIAFTGSSLTGGQIAAKAAAKFKRCTLELGGKSPLIICPDADLEKAAHTLHHGLFFNMGQCCVASSRAYVHESIYDEFAQMCVAKAKACLLCDPSDSACDQGPLVDKIQFDKVMKYIETGKSEGAKCLIGGKQHGTTGLWVEPTVFGEVSDSMVISREEIFGPVLCLSKYSDLEEVIRRANDTPYGLGAGVCTKSFATANHLATRLKAGTVYINCYNVFDPAAPFGGFKQSGLARELGEAGLQNYIENKTVFVNCKL